MNVKNAAVYALLRLEDELPPIFLYHGIDHTREVIEAAKYFAALEDLSQYQTDILITAAAFHDLGYIDGAPGHEERSAQEARKVLCDFGYTRIDAEAVAELILATRLPCQPKNILEAVLCDADIAYLGGNDFYLHIAKFRAELSILGKDFPEQEWWEFQLKFLSGVRFHSPAARKCCARALQKRIQELKYYQSKLQETGNASYEKNLCKNRI